MNDPLSVPVEVPAEDALRSRDAASDIERRAMEGAEYHRAEGLSQSMLKVFREDPERFFELYVSRVVADASEPTDSQRFGLALERLVFYGETGHKLIPPDVLNEQGHRKGGRWTEFKNRMEQEHGPGVSLLTIDEWDKKVGPVMTACDKLREHPRASKLLWGQGDPHVAYFWTDEQTGLRCKCQLDILSSRGIIVDLKAMASVSARDFASSVYEYGYHWQAWWYQQAVRRATGETMPFVFVCAKNKPSHHAECYELGADWMRLAELEIRRSLADLKAAYDTGDWHSATHGDVTVLNPPSWVLTKTE
jgi:hypothetical protein